MSGSAKQKISKPSKPWVLYILSTRDRRYTYSGVTTNLARRLRQHNKEIKGGAKYTAMRGPWHVIACVWVRQPQPRHAIRIPNAPPPQGSGEMV